MTKIPPDRAEFFFSREIGHIPTEFVADDRDNRRPDGLDRYKHLSGSLGCHCSGWLSGDERYCHESPEAIFASLCLSDLPDVKNVMHVLKEMTKIEGQTWAHRMLKALEAIENSNRD